MARMRSAMQASILVMLVACALLAGASCSGTPARELSPAPSNTSAISEVERVLRDRIGLLSEGTVNGVITLVRVGDETRVVTVGLADAAAKEPMRPDATFPIASVTKTMVATAILQQVESGKLALDDSVEKWLPRHRHKGRPDDDWAAAQPPQWRPRAAGGLNSPHTLTR